MLSPFICLATQHDMRLVALAVVVCAVASFTTISLSYHAGRAEDWMKRLWLTVAAMAGGFGIWATHFIAMLAFSPGMPTSYSLAPTLASLGATFLLLGVGLAVAQSRAVLGPRSLGGAIVGVGIAVMHYTGMSALVLPGRIHWDPFLVVASLGIGVAFGVCALSLGLRDRTWKSMLLGTACLTLAICGLHFTAMGAASLIPDPSITVAEGTIPGNWLAILVSFAAITILLMTLAAVALDLRDQRQAEREADRMRAFANAASEGLLVCDGDVVVSANAAFAALVGVEDNRPIAKSLEALFPSAVARNLLRQNSGLAVETSIRSASGAMIVVEAVGRPITFAGKPHTAIAVKDLRDRKQAQQDIHFLAHHDTLTGLANRATFNDRLDELIVEHQSPGAQQTPFLAVMCLDLDRFKEINDLFGHAAGDDLLRAVGQAITQALGPGQMAARLGGDEFAVVAANLSDPKIAGKIADVILETLRAENESPRYANALVSTSIGIAVYPTDGTDRATLMNHADTALYQAKAEARGTYRFFERTMGQQLRDRRMLEHDLRNAITRGELSLVYQPQVRVGDQLVVGFEALLRWKSAERGQVLPAVFIPVAEECGLILRIGEWVLREACREAASWEHPLSIAVNVSAVQLHNPKFAQLVHEVLIESTLSPVRLELEVTETALIRDINRALATLRQLKSLGVRIAMDDFGTGYSSLSNLRAFPFDKIKIDASFIKSVTENGQAATIVRAVLGLGRGLQLPVLAEGVETAAELAFLEAECCHEVQGYYLGRPQAIATFSSYTHAGEPAAPATALEDQRVAQARR